MPARKLTWLDPFIASSIVTGKQKLPLLFDYLELLAHYFFELVTIVVIARIHHLHSQHDSSAISKITDRIIPATRSVELNQIQALTSQCLGIVPLDDRTILNLRQVSLPDRKNCYRRISDAIATLGDVQVLLLAVAYEDGIYEQFFELDLNLDLNVGGDRHE